MSKAKVGQTDSAYQAIKAMILKSQLTPGSFISEAELQGRLQFGRTPTREALIRLSCEDLVNIHPRKGIEINHISPRRLYDIYEIRQLVEPAFLRENFESIDADELSNYKSRFLESSRMLKTGGADAVYDATMVDADFHTFLMRPAGNQQYVDMMYKAFDYLTMVRVNVFFNRARFSDGITEHGELLDAIASHDVESSIRLLQIHLQKSYFSIMRDLSFV